MFGFNPVSPSACLGKCTPTPASLATEPNVPNGLYTLVSIRALPYKPGIPAPCCNKNCFAVHNNPLGVNNHLPIRSTSSIALSTFNAIPPLTIPSSIVPKLLYPTPKSLIISGWSLFCHGELGSVLLKSAFPPPKGPL